MARSAAMRLPPTKLSVTRCGGGVTQSGVSYPGGLDQTTPSLMLQPGAVINGVNFECSQSGGYGRIKGYERFDGRPAPSAAIYQIVQLASFVNAPNVGDTVTQATSGATGKVIAVTNMSGAYYIAVTKVTGTFDTTHDVSVSATLIGTAIPITTPVSPVLNAQYLAAAADVYRADIHAVPGSGPIRGVVAMVFSNQDFVYAFRDNVGGTACNIYVNSASGWQQVPYFDLVTFTAGTGPGGAGSDYEPPDGTTITQGGVTATVKRVIWESGTFAPATHTAAGQLVITAPTGGNFASGTATLGDGTALTLSGAQVAIAPLPGGKYEFVKANFTGSIATRRIYGCDGVNKAFEFDGTIYAPITTGLSTDAPDHIVAHKNFLFLSYLSSILYSGVGTPFKFGSVDGGGEIATGDVVTGMVTVPGSQTTATLAVFMRTNTSFLYGLDPTTFNFVTFNDNMGAMPYSVQNLYDTFCFDILGVVNIKTTLNYGNFLPTTLTKNILPFIQQERTKLAASTINRSKSQYRVFFSDGYGLYLTMVNASYLGAVPVQFPNPVACADNETTSIGNEVTYFGSSDSGGFIYQLDSGTGFDGAPLNAFITFAWDALKSPQVIKRFRRASIEMQSNTYAEITFGYQLGYGTPQIGVPANTNYPSNFSAPYWDQFTWDQFTWDGQTLAPTAVDMVGSAENAQVTITSATNYIDAFNVNSIIYHYAERRLLRGAA